MSSRLSLKNETVPDVGDTSRQGRPRDGRKPGRRDLLGGRRQSETHRCHLDGFARRPGQRRPDLGVFLPFSSIGGRTQLENTLGVGSSSAIVSVAAAGSAAPPPVAAHVTSTVFSGTLNSSRRYRHPLRLAPRRREHRGHRALAAVLARRRRPELRNPFTRNPKTLNLLYPLTLRLAAPGRIGSENGWQYPKRLAVRTDRPRFWTLHHANPAPSGTLGSPPSLCRRTVYNTHSATASSRASELRLHHTTARPAPVERTVHISPRPARSNPTPATHDAAAIRTPTSFSSGSSPVQPLPYAPPRPISPRCTFPLPISPRLSPGEPLTDDRLCPPSRLTPPPTPLPRLNHHPPYAPAVSRPHSSPRPHGLDFLPHTHPFPPHSAASHSPLHPSRPAPHDSSAHSV